MFKRFFYLTHILKILLFSRYRQLSSSAQKKWRDSKLFQKVLLLKTGKTRCFDLKRSNTHCFISSSDNRGFFVWYSANSSNILNVCTQNIRIFMHILIKPCLPKCWCDVWGCCRAPPWINDTNDFLLFIG